MVTTLMPTSGLDRARPAAAHGLPTSTWRPVTASVDTCVTTALGAFGAAFTTNLANGGFTQTIQRPTRLLGTRST